MKRHLAVLLSLWLCGHLSAQYNCEVISASSSKINLASEPFRLDSWPQGDGTFRYSYNILPIIEAEALIIKIFSPGLMVKLNEYGHYDTSNVHFLQVDLNLSVVKYDDGLEISFFTKLNNFDTAGFRKILLKTIESTPSNESFICDCLPRDIDTLWYDKLEGEVMDLIVKNNIIYPPNPWEQHLITLEVNKNGIGVAKHPTDDSTFTYSVNNKFPVVVLNGKPVSYKIEPHFLYETYFTHNILRDIMGDSSNAILINEDQRLYFYDLGHPQMYSGFDDYEYGEYYIVELDEEDKIAYKQMVGFYDPSSLATELYNKDDKPDFNYYFQYDYRQIPHTTKTIFYKDSTWEFEYIEFTNYLGETYYEYFADQQAFDKEYAYDFGLEEPTDTLLENWSSTIFSQGYKYYTELIKVEKIITDVTSEADLQKKKVKRKYKYEYYMFSLFNTKLNYKGESKEKGEKMLKQMRKHMDYYRMNPDKLDSDLRH